MACDVSEDQFAFAARVAGVDEGVDILALDQFGEALEPGLVTFDGSERETGRDVGDKS